MNMHVMERDQGVIVGARLAEIMKVSHVTVAMTLKRMERDHWITRKGNHEGIHLTDAGKAAAHSVVRRHMLIEWLLLKILQVPYLEIHEEAHHLEHAISPAIEARLVDILGNPKFCPHGNPFPGFEEAASGWVPLTKLAAGDRIVIRRLHEFAEDDRDLIRYLWENGISAGKEVGIQGIWDFNQVMNLEVGGKLVPIGFGVAQLLYAEKI